MDRGGGLHFGMPRGFGKNPEKNGNRPIQRRHWALTIGGHNTFFETRLTRIDDMNAKRIIGLTVIGIAMLGAGTVLAEELPLPTDATTPRAQMQKRMLSMTPEEQRLMRETSSDRRNQMENKQTTQDRGMHRGGGGRGKGGGRNRSVYAGVTS
jgi:hypothetical protein